MSHEQEDANRLLNAKEACEVLGGSGHPISYSTLYRAMKRGSLPQPIRVGGGGVLRWRHSDLVSALRPLAPRD